MNAHRPAVLVVLAYAAGNKETLSLPNKAGDKDGHLRLPSDHHIAVVTYLASAPAYMNISAHVCTAIHTHFFKISDLLIQTPVT